MIYHDDDIIELVGLQTELTNHSGPAGLTVSGAMADDAYKTLAESSSPIDEAVLTQSGLGKNFAYFASTAITWKGWSGHVKLDLGITPHCAANGDVVALEATVRWDDRYHSVDRTGHNAYTRPLMRATPAIETGPENQGKTDTSH